CGLWTEWGTLQKADLVKKQAVRLEADKKSAILKEMEDGDTVTVLEQSEDWSEVQTQDLLTGYIETKYLTNIYEETQTAVNDVAELECSSISKDYPIVLAWDMVTNVDANSLLSDRLQSVSGLTTLSPTWFSLADDEGTVASIASQSYVDTAHTAGYEVWGLVDNLTYPEVSTYNILSDSEKRAYVIEQLISYAGQYGLDGINVDFESLSEEAGEPFIQFIRELSIQCRKEGLVLSVDNYVPAAYNDFYNRKEQGVFADYVIIMGYDEHYAGSTESGSVASIDYVRTGIEKTVAEVPAEKVINALPLYTRIWIETPKTDEEIAAEDTNTEYIPYNLNVQTVGMDDALNAVKNAGAETTWDETTAQNYAEWTKEDSTYKVWLEDTQSLTAKLQVMENNQLAGVAVWQLGYADSSVWDVIAQYYAQ
ncbi:MAG TPA: glycosyl hydrolase family 18 protein, partial [Lachnospiraceae bacterium]|nr:glycosyl hydrolase family 18 protein [Lachnospiraceae bacterium]